MTSMNRLRTWRIWCLDHFAPTMISDFVQVVVRVGSVFLASHSRRAREYGLDFPIRLLFCPADLGYYILRHFWDWTGRKLLHNTVERAGASELVTYCLLYSWLIEVVESWLSAWQNHITATFFAQMSRSTIRCEPVDHDLETTINVGTNWGLECTCCLLHFVALVNRLWDGPFWFAPEVPWTRTVLLSLASQSRDIISLPFIIDEARHMNFFFVFSFFHILRLCATVCTCMLYGGQILQFLYCGQMVPLSSAVVFSISKMWWRGEDCSCHGQKHGRRR